MIHIVYLRYTYLSSLSSTYDVDLYKSIITRNYHTHAYMQVSDAKYIADEPFISFIYTCTHTHTHVCRLLELLETVFSSMLTHT